jgi:TRAP-type C4-dicarboxylate transport system permease small subunit
MSEAPPGGRAKASPAARAVLVLGGVGLLGAMATDSLAVIGRRLQLPVVGSVELVQAFVVLAASASIVLATLAHEHASVRVLFDRAPRRLRDGLRRVGDLLGACFFSALSAGSAWILWELRDGAEVTEVLGLPVMALRAVWLVSTLIVAAVYAARVFKRGPGA